MPVAPGGEADQLDPAAPERPGDVAAQLEIARVVILGEPVVADDPAGRDDVVGLAEVEPAQSGAEVQMGGAVLAGIILPRSGDIGGAVGDLVHLAAIFEQLSARQPVDCVEALLGLDEIVEAGRDVEGRCAAAEQSRSAALRPEPAVIAARERAGDVPGQPARGGGDQVQNLRLA